jgi:hypothetical protein
MMVSTQPESAYAGITRWASHAPGHLLRVLAWSGCLGAIGVFLIDPTQWFFAVGMVAVAALGAWGLADHRLAVRRSRSLMVVELVLAVVGGLAALTAVFVAIFWLLGPAPHF